jgi:cardiolipin synthase
MEVGQIAVDIPWTVLLALLLGTYTLSVAIFLILENRSPQSTFAWLFLFIVLPGAGLLIYMMFGRNRHVFSRERRQTRVLEDKALAERAARVMAEQPQKIAALADTQGE